MSDPLSADKADNSNVGDDQPMRYTHKLKAILWIESRGIQPIDSPTRIDPNFSNIFTLWLSANLTIAAFSTGTLGPAVYNLDLSSSLAVIGSVNVVSCALPAVLGLMGPRTGMRQMVLARWAFGYLVVLLPALLNCATMISFCLLNSIVGGQALVSASRDFDLSLTVGIVIIAVVALGLSFLGYKALHLFERFAWIPLLVAFLILAICAGIDSGLSDRADLGPVTVGSVLSFMAVIFGWTISWAPLASDFNTYMREDCSRVRLFLYTFLGLYLPCCLVQMLGAAIYLGATANSDWMAAYQANSVGGLIGQVLLERGLGNFARFLMVVFALGIVTNNAPTIYSFSLNCQIILPWAANFPRWLFTIAGTAIYLVLAIVGKDAFTATLDNFTGLLSYWASVFVVIILLEHYVFRHNDYTSYHVRDWNTWRRLPPGIAAFVASLCGAGGAAIGMDQICASTVLSTYSLLEAWSGFRGPVAKAISSTSGGDLGFEMAAGMATLGYIVARHLEQRYIEPRWIIKEPMEVQGEEDAKASLGS